MIGIKYMEMPHDCWQCELIEHDNCSGSLCSVTGIALYPMGQRNTRPKDCPLVELSLEKNIKPYFWGNIEGYLKWCETTGNAVSGDSYHEFADQEYMNEKRREK